MVPNLEEARGIQGRSRCPSSLWSQRRHPRIGWGSVWRSAWRPPTHTCPTCVSASRVHRPTEGAQACGGTRVGAHQRALPHQSPSVLPLGTRSSKSHRSLEDSGWGVREEGEAQEGKEDQTGELSEGIRDRQAWDLCVRVWVTSGGEPKNKDPKQLFKGKPLLSRTCLFGIASPGRRKENPSSLHLGSWVDAGW